ncbi:MAG: hypothetical protein AB2421_18360, partial [Thermotaleaceae bacterium]
MEGLIHFLKNWFFLMLFLFLFFLGIDEYSISRLEADVRNAIESAEQATIIRALDVEANRELGSEEVDSFVFMGGSIGLEGMGFHVDKAEKAFKDEMKRALFLDNNMKPTNRRLKDFSISKLDIQMINGHPRVTAIVRASTKLYLAPLIG